MAKQKGVIKLTGDLDGVGFFERNGKYFARKSNAVSGDRIKNDPSFVRTRENMSEFSSVAKSAKLLRDTLRPLLTTITDGTLVARLNRLLSEVKKLDTQSARGHRSVAGGIAAPEAKAIMRSFNFNAQTGLNSVVYKPVTVNTTTGAITIENLFPADDMAFPPSATHVVLAGAWAKINFATQLADIAFSDTVNVALSAAAADVVLTPDAVPVVTAGTGFFLLSVTFCQEMNGVLYKLRDEACNAAAIVEMA